ncbi:hypothetical protein [Cellulophaga lytica]|uniref:hypothetical protein n=1 Tax=Cellulophaga lytica TaxID=979 RepID=UPI000B5D080C|nr:hypothetical protein [Cellulophaga lytica]SNQ42045.1 hypothetical protein CL8139_100056 [Cellulophaga lytica]
MITSENHLHNQYLIKRAALDVFEILKQKYGFEGFNEFSKYNSNDCAYIGLKKKGIIIYCFISKRETYEFHILEKGKEKYNSTTVDSLFMKKFPPLSKESKKEIEKKKLINITPYSFEYYYESMIWDIKFLEKHYPEILENGSTPH